MAGFRKILKNCCLEHHIDYEMFFLCPFITKEEETGYHWCLETNETDQSKLDALAEFLDNETIRLNSGYKLSRNSNSRLIKARVSRVPLGSIDEYILGSKQFGQGKFLTIHNSLEEPKKFFEFHKLNLPKG